MNTDLARHNYYMRLRTKTLSELKQIADKTEYPASGQKSAIIEQLVNHFDSRRTWQIISGERSSRE